jgi:hypothetical protein
VPDQAIEERNAAIVLAEERVSEAMARRQRAQRPDGVYEK